MKIFSPPSPTFFYRLIVIILIPSLIYFGMLVIDLLLHLDAPGGVPGGGIIFRLLVGLVIGPATMIVGTLIVRRVPGNVIGLLLILYGIGITATSTRFDVESPGVAVTFFVENFFISAVQLPAFVCLLFYFPNGKIYPRRAANWVSGFAIIQFFGVLIEMLAAERMLWFGDITMSNPVFVPQLAALNPFSISFRAGGFFGLPFILAVISLILRYRTLGMLERSQVRWLAFGGLIGVALSLGWILAYALSVVDVWRLLFNVAISTFPMIAVGNAILRHKLYDIDIIIRRTLIYSVLTTILAGVYFIGVILTQQLFKALTGQTSDLAIVISTLLIAALFSPVRRRVQNTIDSRLYRRKYDAEKTLAAFNQTLRDEVDVETLKTNLIMVVDNTMQPDKIALWIKE